MTEQLHCHGSVIFHISTFLVSNFDPATGYPDRLFCRFSHKIIMTFHTAVKWWHYIITNETHFYHIMVYKNYRTLWINIKEKNALAQNSIHRSVTWWKTHVQICNRHIRTNLKRIFFYVTGTLLISIISRGKQVLLEEPVPIASLPITNATWTNKGLKLGPLWWEAIN